MPSFLHSLDRSSVSRDPFPHVYVNDLIDDALCRQLVAELPPIEDYVDGRTFGDDEKAYLRGIQLLSDARVSEAWKRVVEDNIHPETYRDFYHLFEWEIERECPELASRLAKVDLSRVGHRGSGKDCDVLLEVELIYFMPIKTAATAERGAHLKTSEKIFESYLCLRSDNDSSSGGDFVLHEIRPGASPKLRERNQVDLSNIAAARTFPRIRNTFVGFLNTSRSVTQMTPRSKSRGAAAYLDILVELSPHMWQPNRLKRFWVGWRRW